MAVVSLKNKVKSRNLLAGNLQLPPSVANLKLWLDAADSSTISLSGSEVTQWTDKSGNNYAFTQGTSSKRPLWGSRKQNNINIVDFDGTDDILTSADAASTWKFMSDGTEYTVFFALIADTQNTRVLLSTSDGNYGNVGSVLIVGATKSLEMGVATGNGSVRSIDCGTATNFADTTVFSYVSFLAKPNNATASERIAFKYKNGTASKPNAASGAPSSSNPTRTLSIGHTEAFVNVPFNGGIGEIIIYTGILSDADQTLVGNYLANKWGM